MSFDWKIRVSDMLKLMGIFIAVVYTVARIELTTGQLSESIIHLTQAVTKLDSKIEIARDDLYKLKERLVVVEHIQGSKNGR